MKTIMRMVLYGLVIQAFLISGIFLKTTIDWERHMKRKMQEGPFIFDGQCRQNIKTFKSEVYVGSILWEQLKEARDQGKRIITHFKTGEEIEVETQPLNGDKIPLDIESEKDRI